MTASVAQLAVHQFSKLNVVGSSPITRFMIDPKNITNFNLSTYQLEENLCFWICVAGKNATAISKSLEKFFCEIDTGQPRKPFEAIKKQSIEYLAQSLKRNGIGCFNIKARSLKEVASSNIDLKTCNVSELDDFFGIGPKTARCFVLHTRKDAKVAGLDTHLLKFLREMGYRNVPASTPSGKLYEKWEEIVCSLVQQLSIPMAEFDLSIWRYYAGYGLISDQQLVLKAKTLIQEIK